MEGWAFRSKDRLCVRHTFKFSLSHSNQTWVGQRSRYSDWLRDGRSGDRIPVGARFSAPVQTGSGAHPASCTVGIGSFPGVKRGQGVTLTPHLLLVPLSRKSRAPHMGSTACTEPQYLYKGALYLTLPYSNQTHRATSRKVAGSIPDWVNLHFSLT